MIDLNFVNLKNDLNDFVLSGNEKFSKCYSGADDYTIEIAAWLNDDNTYVFCCYVSWSWISRVCKEDCSHVSVSFLNEVIRHYGK